MNTCSIIIASYNEAINLKKCLDSIFKLELTVHDLEIIVIDNNSTDNTASMIKEYPQVVYLKEEKQGAAFARNTGIRYASGDILVFLDADTTVHKNWLHNLLSPFDNASIGAVGGGIFPFKENNIISQYLGISLFMRYPRYGHPGKVRGFPSCNLAVRKDLASSGFDTETFTIYGEDKDLCLKVINAGFTVWFAPDAIVYHQHPDSFTSLIFLLIKSSEGRLAFGKKHMTAPDILLLNSHFPIIYPLLLLLALFSGNSIASAALLTPVLLYLAYNSILFYIKSGKTLLCFLIKPLLDVISLYVIYSAYTFLKVKTYLEGR